MSHASGTMFIDASTTGSVWVAVAGESPVIRYVNFLIASAVQDGASDIHIEPGDNALRIRYRIDGRLTEKLRPPFQMQAAVASRKVDLPAGVTLRDSRLLQEIAGLVVRAQQRDHLGFETAVTPARLGHVGLAA